MSTYCDIEESLRVILSASIENVVRGDGSILDMGVTEAVVLEPGSFTTQPLVRVIGGTLPDKIRDWTILIYAIAMYGGDRVVTVALATLRDSIIGLVDNHPTLDMNNILVMSVAADGDPQDVYDQLESGPLFSYQILRLTVRQLLKASGGTYA